MLDLRNTHINTAIAILGFGREGKSTLRFLLSRGFQNITVLDKREIQQKREDILYVSGEKYLDNLGGFEIIFKSPGISPYHPSISPYKEKLSSQSEIFFSEYSGKVIGITGTKGKSTVSSITYECLKKLGYNVKLVGNIGLPVLDEINVGKESYDYIVYELSSYMLENFSPPLFIGYVNNIFPCHLDWHTSLDIYKKAKYNIITKADYSIVHSSLKGGDYHFPDTDKITYQNNYFYYHGNKLFSDDHIHLLGEHNRTNICGVLTILSCIEDNLQEKSSIIQDVLKNFQPLKHRLENIGTYHDIIFIDDGAAVTPDATITAIHSLKETETLLVGGKDIGMDQSMIEKEILESNIKNLILFPETGYSLFKKYTENKDSGYPFTFIINGKIIHCLKTQYMKEAIKFSFQNTQKGKAVLLSSAAQSYSLWNSFEEKGQEYKKHIQEYEKL